MSVAEKTGAEMVRTVPAGQPGPIILDLGKKKRKSIKALRNGKGKLLNEVLDAVEELRTVGTISQDAQPVVVIVREKPKTNGILPMLGV